MILRREKQAPPSAASGPTASDLRKLAPFRNLPENLTESVSRDSRLIYPRPGTWAPKKQDDLYFLLRGEMQFTAEHETARKLRHDFPAANYPIPTNHKWSIKLGRNVEILAIPSHFLKLNNVAPNKGAHAAEPSLERPVDEISSEIYLRLCEAVKNNRLQIPSLPDIAVRIGIAIDDPNTQSADIARLIQLDPSLATRIMGVVNSAAFGAAAPVRSIEQAVTRLGRQQVRSLVYSCIIKGLFRTRSPELKTIMRDLWRHSARVAAISFVLARETPGLDPNRALLAGLIHDIGAIPVLQMAQDMPQVNRQPEMILELIHLLKGEVGAMALDAWNFDPELVALALEAEHWHRQGHALADELDVVLLAQLHSFIGDKPHLTLPPINQIPAFEKLALGQLTPKQSIDILDNAAKEIAEIERMLSAG